MILPWLQKKQYFNNREFMIEWTTILSDLGRMSMNYEHAYLHQTGAGHHRNQN